MDPRHGKSKMNAEIDRFSNLPDGLIHKILSFVSIKKAIETSELSSRWRYIWTSMPSLNFSSEEFKTVYNAFDKFVTHVLSRRNDQIEVSSVKLTHRGNYDWAIEVIVKRILKYAFSHNVQQLNITITNMGGMMEFPLSLLSSQSLKHLTLYGYGYQSPIVTPLTWELPSLTTLNLYHVTLSGDGTDKCGGLFSSCPNLKNLTFKNCLLGGFNGLNIRHPGLTNLTFDNGCAGVNVDTPQLKNLTISKWRKIHLISAPNLSSLHYEDYGYEYFDEDDYYNGNYGCDCGLDSDDRGHDHHDEYKSVDPLQFSTQPSHLEKVNIVIERPFEDRAYIHKLFNLVQQVRSVKFLTLNLELVKLLFSSMERISHQPSPFSNLKSLKIYPTDVTLKEPLQPEVPIALSPEVKNYLLDSSQGATLTIVSREEIRAMMYVASARNVLRELQVNLEEWKETSQTNLAHMRKVKAPMYRRHMARVHEQMEDTKLKWHVGKRVTDIQSYWADLNRQMEIGVYFTDSTISMLQKIQTALKRMPDTYKAKLRAEFVSLSLEADTMMDNMMDRMKMQCDKEPNRPNVYFHQPAARSSNLSS